VFFASFDKTGQKSSETVKKACFYADSDKIRSNLLKIMRKMFFAFFVETGKYNQKSSEKHVHADSDEFRSNSAITREKKTFLPFLMKLEKIIRNCEKSMFSC